jgi:Flp pilus assembly protein TadB
VTSSPEAAEAIRALAALLRTGASPRRALEQWHHDAPSRLRGPLRRMARKLKLGASIDQSLAVLHSVMGSDLSSLRGFLAVHRRVGGDLAETLDLLAHSVERRAAAEAAGRAAGAGAILSGRVVAGLPLLMVPLAPAAHAPLFDRTGLLLLAMGGGLAVGGMVWIARLVPKPPGDDPAAVVADIISSVLQGGTGLATALEIAADHAPDEFRAPMQQARRRVRLGTSWPDALIEANDESIRALSLSIGRASELGVPVADALRSFSANRRAQRLRAFDAATRRAPVWMVLPLSLCVLPAYALLGLGPYLRSISL